jgi:hypothetical protein
MRRDLGLQRRRLRVLSATPKIPGGESAIRESQIGRIELDVQRGRAAVQHGDRLFAAGELLQQNIG